jgi:hypothetical protein
MARGKSKICEISVFSGKMCGRRRQATVFYSVFVEDVELRRKEVYDSFPSCFLRLPQDACNLQQTTRGWRTSSLKTHAPPPDRALAAAPSALWNAPRHPLPPGPVLRACLRGRDAGASALLFELSRGPSR